MPLHPHLECVQAEGVGLGKLRGVCVYIKKPPHLNTLSDGQIAELYHLAGLYMEMKWKPNSADVII